MRDKIDEVEETTQYSGLRALYCLETGDPTHSNRYKPITEEGQRPRYLETNLQQRRGIFILLRLRLGALPTRERSSRWSNHMHKY